MNDALLQEVRRWQRFAWEDLREAERQVQRAGTVPRHPAWLAQQAAEKALKAALIFLQIEFPFTHNLESLHALIPARWRMKTVDPPWSLLWNPRRNVLQIKRIGIR
ncbi:HEPN domain-containing protein [Salisaeta longa]|uniref:HEPN domain-containing protein n=1 Tax=Salisaeta longa TaxID=503170 RepID=UPI000A01E03B|nr:HEPN domain-containing protein [Salisaeta longa]